MRVSIVTPVLNAISWIERCIATVAQQGDVVREHIIVDGGSSDGTAERIDALRHDHPRLVLIVAPGCNQSATMNIGTRAAAGEIIGILNADDYYEAGAVGRAVARLEQAEAPALVAGDCRIIDAGRRFAWNRPTDLRLESLLLGWEVAQFPCNPSAYFYHREVHDRVGGYAVADEFTMDLDFLLKCAAQVTMLYVPEHWGNFRRIPGGKTFEDARARARGQAMLARHINRLDAQQLAVMERIRLEKKRAAIGGRPPFFGFAAAIAASSLMCRRASGTTLAGADCTEHLRMEFRYLAPEPPLTARRTT